MKTLEVINDESWALLIRASKDKKSPMRTPTIATVSRGMPSIRTVVLRQVDKVNQSLVAFTDVRSQKVEDLMNNRHLAWHFYHPKKQIQLRVESSVIIHNQDDLAKEYWQNLPVHSRKTYATTLAPGAAVKEYSNGLPAIWEGETSLEDTEYAFEHFAVLVAKVESIEYLELSRVEQRRARLQFASSEKATWLIP